jgi:hypothetical protein
MAVHQPIGRIPSIFLLALLAVAVVAGTAHYLSRPGPEAETASASQITVVMPSSAMLTEPTPDTGPVEALPATDEASAPTDAVALAPLGAETMPDELPPPAGAEAEPEVAAELEASPAPDAVQTASVPLARLVTEPQHAPTVQDPVRSTPRPKNLAPIPTRAPRAAKADWIAARKAATPFRTGTGSAAPNAKSSAAGASSRAAALFKHGTEIKIKKDASVYITSRNIPKNDRPLETYNADRPNGGRVRTRAGEATAVPGLLGIAKQAHRAQDPNGQNAEAYSLADAMRDAVWRKNTAARLKSLTTAQNACVDSAGGAINNLPLIGLIASC